MPATRLPRVSHLLVACCFGMLLLTGCKSEKELPVFPVSGKVNFKEPPVNAIVVLHPTTKPADPSSVVAPSGKVGSDGSFKITTYKAFDGAPPGDYVATVTWNKVVTTEGGTGAGPNVLPTKFSKPDSSPLKVTVKSGPNELPPFEIAE